MPLNPATLTTEILKLTDENRPDFKGFPVAVMNGEVDEASYNAQTAANWADALAAFFGELVVPPIIPGAILAARSAFEGAFLAAMKPAEQEAGGGPLQAGLTAMVAILAASAVPPVALPPPGDVAFSPGGETSDPSGPAISLASSIFAWAKTGLYGVPPSPPTIPWS